VREREVMAMTPTLNLNGTSGAELLEQVNAVLAALRDTHKAMADAGPHGRDYQHDATGESYRVARGEHIERMQTVHNLISAYEKQQESIDSQMLEREAARDARITIQGAR
jgi:uncharacterized Ntn-hydrolase superfamily protein